MKITATNCCIFASLLRQSSSLRLNHTPLLFIHHQTHHHNHRYIQHNTQKQQQKYKHNSRIIIQSRSSSSFARTIMSETKTNNNNSKNNSKNSNENESKSQILPTEIYKYPLIDVDCNLIHSDLASLIPTSASASASKSASNEDSNSNNDNTSIYSKSNSKYLNILHHPSTKRSNIQGMFSPSSTIEEAEEFHNVLLQSDIQSRNNIDVRMSVGIHPYHTGITEIGSFSDGSSNGNDGNDNTGNDNGNDNVENIKQRIKTLLEKDEDKKYITCIGETGLDYSDGFPNKKEQLPWFEFQLHQAKLYNMPLFIHERLAFDDTIALIDKVFPKEETGSNGDSDSDSDNDNNNVNIIIHCYTGNKEELKEYISRGYYISLSGYILKKGDGPIEINNCLKDGMIPLEKLMIETDAPYMGYTKCRESYYEMEALINDDFQSLKSKKKKSLVKGIYPNVPSALPNVLEHVVECLNEGRKERGEEVLDVEYVASTLFQNSKNFFGIQ